MKPEVKWEKGAYLSIGELWLCLSKEAARPSEDYSHIAFSIPSCYFAVFSSKVHSTGVNSWKENTSEGRSLYILDPDGHKLEIHVGSLESRLKELKSKPYKGVKWY